MTAKELKERLEKLPDDCEIVCVNKMGCPAYDYEGQRFWLGFSEAVNELAIVGEVK